MSLVAPARAADTFASAYLSELLADNQRGLQDEDGDRSGWIEIHNGGTTTVNFAGWFLTDSPTNRTKWRFPAVSLLPDKYMVVFASAKGRTNDLAHLHTNFRLDKRGSYLALVNRGTNVVSEFAPAYPRQSADISFGRVRGEPAIHGHFLRPTPGRPNAISGPGFSPEVVFSKPSGNFIDPFTVELFCGSTAAVVRYTLDGTLPTSNSPVYGAPLLITATAQVRARAYQEGLLPGPPRSEVYLRLFTDVLDFTSTLPVLVMDTLGREAPVSGNLSFVHVSLHEPVNGKTSLTNPPTLTTRAGFRVRGSTSSGMPQQSFAVEFLDEFNQEKHLPILGLPADSDWILYAPNAYDPVMIHNPFIHQLSRESPSRPRTEHGVTCAQPSCPKRDLRSKGVQSMGANVNRVRSRQEHRRGFLKLAGELQTTVHHRPPPFEEFDVFDCYAFEGCFLDAQWFSNFDHYLHDVMSPDGRWSSYCPPAPLTASAMTVPSLTA